MEKKNTRRDARRDRIELSDTEVNRLARALAPRLVSQVKSEHHEFWIDHESHYKDHIALRRLVAVFDEDLVAALKEMAVGYREGRSFLARTFLRLALLGMVVAALIGIWHYFWKGGGH